MKHIRKINENTGGEYLMIVHTESGDEIHLDLIEMSHYPNIQRLLNLSYSSQIRHTNDPNCTCRNCSSNELVGYINQNKVSADMMCQTYVLEDYLFNGYNITKVINIAELGC